MWNTVEVNESCGSWRWGECMDISGVYVYLKMMPVLADNLTDCTGEATMSRYIDLWETEWW